MNLYLEDMPLLDPEEQNDVLKEVADEYAKRYEEDCKDLVEGGALTFGRLPPKDRLAGYMTDTRAADLPLILDENYLDNRRLGLAPPLEAELLLAQQEAQKAEFELLVAEAQQMGMPAPMPPELPPVPPLWPGLLPSNINPLNPFSDFFFEWFAKDFRQLLKAEMKREGGL